MSRLALGQGIDELPPSQKAQALQYSLPHGSEYSAGVYPGEVLLPVYLIGAVGRPGIYNIPKKTELLRLITLAGGVQPTADSQHATIKRRINAEERVIAVNIDRMMQTMQSASLYLEPGDVIFVPSKEQLISTETSSLLAFIASVFGLVTTTLVLYSQFTKK